MTAVGSTTTGDILTVLEAAYEPAPTEGAWMERALEALAPHLDRGMGVFAHAFTRQGAEFSRGPLRGVGATAEMLEKGEASFAFLDEMPRPAAEEMLRRVYPSTPAVGWFSDFSGTGPNFVHQLVFGSRVSDALGVIASEPSGHGCVFNALAAERRALSRSARAMWTRVASHLAIGYRLARQRDVRTEAVLHPSGRLEHAEEVAASRDDRDALSEATRAIDRARGRLRRVDQEEAVAIWTGLVRGRWSLVEQVDHDGKRYLFAKRNPPSVAAWSTLTEAEAQVVAHAAEGQPHKFIAYELGMSLAGVAAHLKRAARKVGARSRLELVSSYIASRPHGAGR